MKLCRFELLQSPGQARSGIFHDNRLYETDGTQAIGLHELSKVRLLAPTGQPPSIREFENIAGKLRYTFANPSRTLGPLGEFDVPPGWNQTDVEIRIVITAKDSGQQIDSAEASDFILGCSVYLRFFDVALLQEETALGVGAGISKDAPAAMGPFITTPEELEAMASNKEKLEYQLPTTVSINGIEIVKSHYSIAPGLSNMLVDTSRSATLNAGDLLAYPPFQKPLLRDTALGRQMQPGDSIQALIEPLGALVIKIV